MFAPLAWGVDAEMSTGAAVSVAVGPATDSSPPKVLKVKVPFWDKYWASIQSAERAVSETRTSSMVPSKTSVSSILCNWIQTGTRSPNRITNWLSAAFQSRIGIDHFFATFCMPR